MSRLQVRLPTFWWNSKWPAANGGEAKTVFQELDKAKQAGIDYNRDGARLLEVPPAKESQTGKSQKGLFRLFVVE